MLGTLNRKNLKAVCILPTEV